jgi:hypothetical protein
MPLGQQRVPATESTVPSAKISSLIVARTPGELASEVEFAHEATGERHANRAATEMPNVGDTGRRHRVRGKFARSSS